MIQYWLQKVSKGAQRTIFDKFSVFRGILVQAKPILLITDSSVRIALSKLCLLCNDDQCLRGKFLYFKLYSIGCKKFQKVHPDLFLTIFRFLSNFSIGQTVSFLKGWLMSQRKGFLRETIQYWWKSFKECTQKHVFQVLGFLRNFSIDQTFTSYYLPFCTTGSNELSIF